MHHLALRVARVYEDLLNTFHMLKRSGRLLGVGCLLSGRLLDVRELLGGDDC